MLAPVQQRACTLLCAVLYEAQLHVDSEATPRFCKARTALCDAYEGGVGIGSLSHRRHHTICPVCGLGRADRACVEERWSVSQDLW